MNNPYNTDVFHVEDKWETVECRNMPPDMWFSDDINLAQATDDVLAEVAMALTICNRCPLRLECAILGMRYDDLHHGIWGGLLPGERMSAAGMTQFSADQREIDRSRKWRRMTGVPYPGVTERVIQAGKRAVKENRG